MSRIGTSLNRLFAPNKILAEVLNDRRRKRRDEYIRKLIILWDLFGESDPEKFIERLKNRNQTDLLEFASEGYAHAGGMMPQPGEPWRSNGYRFVNSFADRFLADIKAGRGTMDYRRRTALYGETGFGMSYLNGVQAAMSERGAKRWRRILHPELSKSGPCPLCTADAQISHPMTEPFVSLHPYDVCSMSVIGVSFTDEHGSVEYGVPGWTSNELTDLLGDSVETRVIHRKLF